MSKLIISRNKNLHSINAYASSCKYSCDCVGICPENDPVSNLVDRLTSKSRVSANGNN